MFRIFAKLKQKIIMKWETESTPVGKPSNVFISDWLPQEDILAHPSLRLFITHCGLGGINEARYHGVPILGIPLYGDHEKNVKVAVNEGWAIELPYVTLNEDTFSDALNELLTNKKYSEVVKYRSVLFRDRPISAMDTAIYWIEYVLRHNGARHMRSNAIELNFFQKTAWDIVVFLLCVLYVVYKVFRAYMKLTHENCFKYRNRNQNRARRRE